MSCPLEKCRHSNSSCAYFSFWFVGSGSQCICYLYIYMRYTHCIGPSRVVPSGETPSAGCRGKGGPALPTAPQATPRGPSCAPTI